MVASGMTQRQIAEELGVSRPAISQQLTVTRDLDAVDPQVLLETAGPALKDLAAAHGYSRLAVFGSIAREQAHGASDTDLLVQAPPGTSSFDFVRFQQLLADVLGRQVDLVEYGGLKPCPAPTRRMRVPRLSPITEFPRSEVVPITQHATRSLTDFPIGPADTVGPDHPPTQDPSEDGSGTPPRSRAGAHAVPTSCPHSA